MGLDITALRHATYLDPQPDEDYADEHYDRFYRAWVNPDFEERAEGLRNGFYTAADAVSFRAGSYSGYNRWREWLSELALGTEPRAVWSDPEAFAGRPFVELIHFADNEGIIGPGLSAKLARDFDDYVGRVTADDEYFAQTYERFREAFKLAADDGLVQFH